MTQQVPAVPAVDVVLVDDHHLFRTGVRASLDDRVHVVGEAASVDEAVRVVRTLAPPVVLLDVHLPGGDGGGGAEVIRACADLTGTRFLALSVSDAAEDVVAVIRAGARGYVTKAIDGPALSDAVRRVADGELSLEPDTAWLLHRLTVDLRRSGVGLGAADQDRLRTLNERITALDALVVARSAFESSMRYRSAVLFGTCEPVEDEQAKRAALDRITENLIPGRVAEVRDSTARELAATMVLRLRIEDSTLKTNSEAWPDDPDEDVAGETWAGVVPRLTTYGDPLPARDLREGVPVPRSVTGL